MSWKSKKVLVTGGAGFIGSNLALRLHAEGADVEVLDSFSPYCGSNPFNLSSIEKRIRIHRIDLTTAVFDTLLQDKDYVFHLAGQIGHNFGQQKPEVDLELNTKSTLRLLESLKRVNSQAVVLFTSTRQIYGEPKKLPVDETHPIDPIDINGIHKLAAENYMKLYHKLHGLKTITLRLTNTYGPRQSIKNKELGVVGWFLNRALLDEAITLAQGGEQVRDFTFVDDVVDACLTAALTENCIGQEFNVSGYKATLKELAETIMLACGTGRLTDLNMTADEKKIQLQHYYSSSEKLKGLTGWEPRHTLQEGVAKTVEYFTQNKSHYLPITEKQTPQAEGKSP